MNKLGHDNPAYKAFRAKYGNNKVPVKEWGKRRHDGERYKPQTGRLFEANFYYA